MPRTVDHDERKSMILTAFVEVALAKGLHAVSLRDVASAAGVSLRLVQYYFETKSGLMQAGLSFLEAQSNMRWTARLDGRSDQTSPRAALLTLFEEAMPTDRKSREFHLLWMSYTVLALTSDEISGRAFIDSPNKLKGRISEIVKQGIGTGDFHSELDAEAEAATLVGLIHGLGTAVLIGQQSGQTALSHLSHYLDRLAPNGR